MDKGTTAIALRGAAAMFVFAVGCGAAVGANRSAPTPDTPATSALSGEMHSPSNDPGGLTGGGALPVVPARLAPLPQPGGCIIGLDCGCIRGVTCPGTVHHRPAPPNDHASDAPAGPGPGPGG